VTGEHYHRECLACGALAGAVRAVAAAQAASRRACSTSELGAGRATEGAGR
jgi:hypothetical protein